MVVNQSVMIAKSSVPDEDHCCHNNQAKDYADEHSQSQQLRCSDRPPAETESNVSGPTTLNGNAFIR